MKHRMSQIKTRIQELEAELRYGQLKGAELIRVQEHMKFWTRERDIILTRRANRKARKSQTQVKVITPQQEYITDFTKKVLKSLALDQRVSITFGTAQRSKYRWSTKTIIFGTRSMDSCYFYGFTEYARCRWLIQDLPKKAAAYGLQLLALHEISHAVAHALPNALQTQREEGHHGKTFQYIEKDLISRFYHSDPEEQIK